MSFSSRPPFRRRDLSRLKPLSRRRLRRRVAAAKRLGAATFLTGAFFLTAPLAARCALCESPVDYAPPANYAAYAPPAVLANYADAAVSANPSNCADRANCVDRSNRAFSWSGALAPRPAVLCELAGISPFPSNEANRAIWAPEPCNATPFFSPPFSLSSPIARSSSSSPVTLTAPSTLSASFPQTAQTLPIVRGAYISNLPIEPFRGRVFAYADASWGKQAEQSSDPFAGGFDVATFGGGVGQDWRLSKNAIWGFGFQGRNIQIDPAESIYEADVDSLAGFLRLSLFGPLWRLDLSLGAAKNWNEQSLGNKDAVKYSSSQWNYEAEFGVRFDKGYTRVEPLVGVRVLTLQEPSEAERRLASNGRPDDYADASYRLKLGSRFSWEYATHLATLKPYLTATWAHEFGDRALYTVGENSPFPIVYRYARHKMARDRLDLGGGVDAALRDTVDVFFHYDVEFAKEYSNYLFYAGFHKKF